MPCGNPHILNLSNHIMTRVMILHSLNGPIIHCHITISQNETLILKWNPNPYFHNLHPSRRWNVAATTIFFHAPVPCLSKCHERTRSTYVRCQPPSHLQRTITTANLHGSHRVTLSSTTLTTNFCFHTNQHMGDPDLHACLHLQASNHLHRSTLAS